MLSIGHGHWLVSSRSSGWSLAENLLNPVHVKPARGAAVLKAVEHFFGFINLPRLKVKDAECRITAGPIGKHIHGAFEFVGGLGRIALEDGSKPESPEYLSRARHARLTFEQGLLGPGNIILAELQQRQR